MTNHQPGDVEVRLAGRTFILRPSYKACIEIEKATGMGVMALARRVSAQQHGLNDAAVIITAGMKAAGYEGASVAKVAEMIFEAGLASVYDVLDAFLVVCVMGVEHKPPGDEDGAGS